MSRTKWCFLYALALLLGLGLAGCPFGTPKLQVEPLATTFGAESTSETIRISNTGTGTLDWTATESLPWLSISSAPPAKQSSTLTGSTTTEIEVITLTLDRSQLPQGKVRGEVLITSNGGEKTVAVSATTASEAQLEVDKTVLDFGTAGKKDQVTITNTGLTALDWELKVSDDSVSWLSATPKNGSLQGTASSTVSLTVDRGALSPNTYPGSVIITSNGGNATVNVSMTVPPFSATPDEIDFGTLLVAGSEQIFVTSESTSAIPLTLDTSTTDPGGNWLSLSALTGSVSETSSLQVTLSANPTGLEPNTYTGHVLISNTLGTFTQVIPVEMLVPSFAVDRNIIPFGTITAAATDTITLQNLGTQSIDFAVSIPTADGLWLDAQPSMGSLPPGGTTGVTLTADPTVVVPGPYESSVSIASSGGTEVITVTMARPKDPALQVAPANASFGATLNQQLIAIWNDGIGTIDWSIDTTAFPAWLSLSPVGANGIAGGTVSGQQTDAITLTVDRFQVPAGQTSLQHSFEVTAAGDDDTPITVNVTLSVPLIPSIEIEADDVNISGVDYINLDIDEDGKTFIVRNLGNGPLDWSIDEETVPEWITSINPAQDNLPPDSEQTVTITVDRSTLDYHGAQATLVINTNDPDREQVLLQVEILVAKVVIIRAIPNIIALGETQTSTSVDVANFGDPETVLFFQVNPSKDWLSVFPETGTSIGTAGTTKDWQAISVAVDRSRLEGRGASAQLTISAFEVEDGEIIPRDDVESVVVDISVEAAELTIEASRPGLRVPSQVRYVLLMRNIQYQAIPLPNARLPEFAEKFVIFEQDEPLELDETNQFMTTGDRIRSNCLILLDYSGSMLESALKVPDPTIADADDPLQALYEATIPQLISELPDTYRIAIGVFSERDQFERVRIIDEGLGSPRFTKDKTLATDRLRNIEVIDHGATALYAAVGEAAAILDDEDGFYLPFDAVDMRALVMVTDGGLTTTIGSLLDITQVVQLLQGLHVRPLFIGWGANIATNPLIRMASPTGGHFYATQNQPTGVLDSTGNPIRIPTADTLFDWCQTSSADPCDQSLPNDLHSQVMFAYTTLNHKPNVSVEGRVTFDDPNDNDNICIEPQGEITGSFSHTQLDFDSIRPSGTAGDPPPLGGNVRLAQISLHSDGLQPGGTTVVRLRADYIPRNLSRLSLNITHDSAQALTLDVVQLLSTQGGIIADWEDSGGATVHTYTSPDDPLLYGEFGDLVEVRITGATTPFNLLVDVLEPVINFADPEAKYVTLPDGILVESDPFLASALPFPDIQTTPPLDLTSVSNLGTTEDQVEVSIFNLGGNHPSTGVGLYWEMSFGIGSAYLQFCTSNDIPLCPDPADAGQVFSVFDPDVTYLVADRAINPGVYWTEIYVEYPLHPIDRIHQFWVTYEVLPPVLSVSPTIVDFPAGITEQAITVANAGQSSLPWSLDISLFPVWLGTGSTGGGLGPDESDRFNLYVYRNQIDPSVTNPSAQIVITSNTSVGVMTRTLTITVDNT